MTRRTTPATGSPRGTQHPALRPPIGSVCFDWGGTLMVDDGPEGLPMCDWPRVTAVPGSRECLASLHGHAPLCIATNAGASDRASIERALNRVGLLPFISHVFCQKEIGHRKDSPLFWTAVEQRLQIPLGHIAMIGDSLEHDVAAPLRLGLQAVWFNERGGRPEPPTPVPTVTDLEDFAGLVLSAIYNDLSLHQTDSNEADVQNLQVTGPAVEAMSGDHDRRQR